MESATSENETDRRRVPIPQVLSLAEGHRQAGRIAQAENLCWDILRARPNHPEALHLLGIIAHQSGQAAMGMDLVRRAIAAAPSVALYHSNLCEMARLAGRLDEALAAGMRSVALDPASAQALNNLGIVYFERNDFDAAIDFYCRSLAIDPASPTVQSNLGNAFRSSHRFDEAIAAHTRALELRPDYVDAMANMASALHLSGRLTEAAALYRRALALAPKNANSHHGLSLLLLLDGNLSEGWAEYEWRWQSTETKPRRFRGAEWRGEVLGNRRLLIHSEQGFGDVIHFCRYLPLIKDRAERPLLMLPAELTELMAENFPWVEIVAAGSAGKIEYDCYVALLSLPFLMQTTLATIPSVVPYLRPPAAAAARWAAKIQPMAGLKVGLVWAGNPNHINDRKRSLPLAALQPIIDVPGVRFFSLQRGSGEHEVVALPPEGIVNLGPWLANFGETAAAVSELDLIITVDTSVAHVAGALGKPAWVMLPAVPDWRWLLDRSDSPWYPTLRLFRQTRQNDWDGVIGQIATELAAMAGGASESRLPLTAAEESFTEEPT